MDPEVVAGLLRGHVHATKEECDKGARLAIGNPESLDLPPPAGLHAAAPTAPTGGGKDGEARETEKERGLPRLAAIALPEPETPYMMDPNKAAGYAIAAFTPMWRDHDVNRSALRNVIEGFRARICKWNKNEDKEPTHVALNQGKLAIPWGRAYDMFLGGLALAIMMHLACWITEIKTPWYRYFMDLDFVQPEKLTGRQIEAAVYIVQRVVRTFFPGKKAASDPAFLAIVCSTGYKPVFANKEAEKAYHAGLAARADLRKAGGMLDPEEAAALQRRVDAMPTPVAWKTGVHIIWPALYVNNDMALIMRESVIAALAEAFGMRVEPMNDWGDVVDVSVYKGSGLRMIANNKSDPCPQCKGRHRVGPPEECPHCPDVKARVCAVHTHWLPLKKRDEEAGRGVKCPTCDGNGRVDTGRPYMPMFIVDAGGYRRKELEAAAATDFAWVVRQTAIRWRGVPRAAASEATKAKQEGDYVYEEPRGQGWTVPKGAPLPVSIRLVTDADGTARYVEEEADLSKAVAKKKKAGGGASAIAITASATGAGAGSASEPRGMSVVLPRADPVVGWLQNFVRTHGGELYKELRVTRVATNKDRTCYFANVHGPNCNYCNNIGREHASNRIYFMFTNEGMVQRCHDRSDARTAEMRYGLCAAYRSAVVLLPHDLKVRLFPKAAAKAGVVGMLAHLAGQGGGGRRADEDEEDTLDGLPAAGADLHAAVEYDPTRDRKSVALLSAGDQLAMALHGVPWSSTLTGHNGAHLVRVGAAAAEATALTMRVGELTTAATMRTLPTFIEVDFGALGQRAGEALKTMGFFTAPVKSAAPAKRTRPVNVKAVGDGEEGFRFEAALRDGAASSCGCLIPCGHSGGGAGAGGGALMSSLAGLGDDDDDGEGCDGGGGDGGCDEEEDGGGGGDEGEECREGKQTRELSERRIQSLLRRQLQYVIDAAVMLPSEDVVAALARGGFAAVVETYVARQKAKPTVTEAIDAKIQRIALRAADAGTKLAGADQGVWTAAIYECHKPQEKLRLEAAYARWHKFVHDHPDAPLEGAVAAVAEGSAAVSAAAAVAGAKRKREDDTKAKTKAALTVAVRGSRFSKLREYTT